MIDTSDLCPELADKIRALEAKLATKSITPLKTSGCRGFLAQAHLYETYRKRGGAAAAPMGVSRHHPFYEGRAAAVDLGISKDLPGPVRKHQYNVMGAAAKELGLAWGGDWKNPEPWHFELPDVDPWGEYINLGVVLDRVRNLFWSSQTKAKSK